MLPQVICAGKFNLCSTNTEKPLRFHLLPHTHIPYYPVLISISIKGFNFFFFFIKFINERQQKKSMDRKSSLLFGSVVKEVKLKHVFVWWKFFFQLFYLFFIRKFNLIQNKSSLGHR